MLCVLAAPLVFNQCVLIESLLFSKGDMQKHLQPSDSICMFYLTLPRFVGLVKACGSITMAGVEGKR